MTCKHKHTKLQPTDEEWLCPKCGANYLHFYVEDSPTFLITEDEFECKLLHKKDILFCSLCNYETTGEKFSKFVTKKHEYINCPFCNCKGFVKKEMLEEFRKIMNRE